MGISERKQREKEMVRAKILTVANQLFIGKGYEGTSIRAISEAVEYSPATIYLYFKDKEDIFWHLQKKAFELLNAHFEKFKTVIEPTERLRIIGKTYLNFAFDNPALYDLMFILQTDPEIRDSSATWQAGVELYKIMEDVIDSCLILRKIKGKDHKVVAFTFWSYIHGQCALLIRQRLPMHEKQHLQYLISQSFEFVFELLLEK